MIYYLSASKWPFLSLFLLLVCYHCAPLTTVLNIISCGYFTPNSAFSLDRVLFILTLPCFPFKQQHPTFTKPFLVGVVFALSFLSTHAAAVKFPLLVPTVCTNLHAFPYNICPHQCWAQALRMVFIFPSVLDPMLLLVLNAPWKQGQCLFHKNTVLWMVITILLYVLAISTGPFPQLHYGFFFSLSFSLTCTLQNILFILGLCEQQETMEFSSLYGVLWIVSLGLEFTNVIEGVLEHYWKPRAHLHPYCVLSQGFRKIKHSHWVHAIDRGQSSLQTKPLMIFIHEPGQSQQ